MSIALGFGMIEDEFEAVECARVDEYVRDAYALSRDGFFSDALVAGLRESLRERSDSLLTQADEYKTGDHPDRYSYFWASVPHDASNIVVVFDFHHINRKHALSPDGWGMMATTRLHLCRLRDVERHLEESNG